MSLRYQRGDKETAGRVSIYRGPLLLAYDQKYNACDEDSISPLDLRRLPKAKLISVPETSDKWNLSLKPWLLVEVPGADGRWMRLCDFANAGAYGTRYKSWLPAENILDEKNQNQK